MGVALGVLVNIFRHLLRSSQIWRFCATVKHEATCIEALWSVYLWVVFLCMYRVEGMHHLVDAFVLLGWEYSDVADFYMCNTGIFCCLLCLYVTLFCSLQTGYALGAS
jgi:hypothetical protein